MYLGNRQCELSRSQVSETSRAEPRSSDQLPSLQTADSELRHGFARIGFEIHNAKFREVEIIARLL